MSTGKSEPLKTVWKSLLTPERYQEIEAPDGAEFLCAREQGNTLAVWYLCDPYAPRTKRKIEICGTGEPAPEGRYIGTGLLFGGKLVMHVFEVK
jgi:hypothetical protein